VILIAAAIALAGIGRKDKAAPAKELLIGLLRYSINPDLARAFIKFTASPEGAAIFAAHGFARQ